MAITANVTNGKLDKTNTTPTQNRKTSSAKASGSNLGYDDFLKLLSAEMQYQDPLEPTSNTDYVAQMATFSQLEATLSMKESMSSSYDQTTKSAALSLVGKEVIVTDKDSASGYYSGKVDYVTYKDGKIQLSINEKMYDYSSLYFPGDKIDIFASGLSDNSTSYKSSFSDKLTDSMWEITMPVDSGRVVLFQLGTQFDFIIYTQNKTILKSSAIVRQRYRKENMYFLAIELINNLEKIQRRQFFRLPCTIDMDFYEVRYDDKAESELEFCKKMYKNHAINSKNMNTVKSVILDISGGGIRFSLSTPLEEGTYFMAQFSLALEECTQQFNIVCKVINCTQSLDYADRYFARSKFIFDRMTEREKIVRFVFEEERRIRRREME